jgi:hypothetical protein
MMHTESHPMSGQDVKVALANHRPITLESFTVEDWWDKLTGGSWMFAEGNPAAMIYAMRSGISGLPLDDEVIYGHIGGIGCLVHVSEIEKAS